MSPRALVTGVSGFAGRQLARQLLDEGFEVAGTVRTRSAEVPGILERSLEIDDHGALRSLLDEWRPDVVFHLAAIVDTVTTPDIMRLHRTNVMGTAAVLEALRDTGSPARVLYASSAFVYGRTAPQAQPIKEDEPLRPLTPYGAGKAAGEVIAMQFARETATEVIVTRAFQHTGPGHVGAYALADWAAQLAEIAAGPGEGVIRCGNIDVERDYLDVRDVAAAYRAAARRGESGQAYNVARGRPRTMRSMLEGLIRAYGVEVRIEVDSARMRTIDQPTFYGDPSKLAAATGWRPAYDIDATLADLAAFWRARVRAAAA